MVYGSCVYDMTFEDDVVAMLPKMRGYARKLTMNNADADDLIQVTILKALSKKHLFTPGTSLSAWMFTIMHHCHTSGVRQATNHSALLNKSNPFPVCNSDAEINILVREVSEEFKRLPAQTQRIIVANLAGVSYDEVAKRENIPVGTVRSRLSRGRARLREFAEGIERY